MFLHRTLVKAGVIHKPEYGYIIGDFVNMDICALATQGETEEKIEGGTSADN